MKRARLGILIMILVSFVTMSITPANAAVSQTIQNKANVLNKLSILIGSGQNYSLDAKLLRSEAAAFIIRMLGKESYVQQNKSQYINTSFTDVKKTDWFAPYIGYCSQQGLLASYTKTKYGPKDTISEKLFLKSMLCVLGYVYEVDFNWSNVYSFAYNTGLVTDSTYLSKTADNNNFKRSQMVEIMYNVLTKDNKIDKMKQIYVLIKNGSVSKATALSSGIIVDTVATVIQLVTPIDQNSISVKLNESVKTVTAGNIKIYESGDSLKTIDVKINSQSADEIILKTSVQTSDKSYTIELSNVTDNEGNVSDKLSGSFKGFRNPEIKSDFFKISKVVSLSKNLLNLYFTQPINLNSELSSCYDIYQNNTLFVKGSNQTLIVKQLGSVKNAVSISLKESSFVEGTEYQLKVSGAISSAYGVKLNEMNGDSTVFTGKGSNSEELKLINTQVLSNKSILLEFNMDINPIIAQQIFNYYITDSAGNPISVNKATVCGDDAKSGKCVKLIINGIFDKTKTYNLMINNINDITRQFSITEKAYSFPGYYPDQKNFQIVFVSPLDAGTLGVYVDRPLDETSVAIASNFTITGVTHTGYFSIPVKTYYNTAADPYLVKLFLPSDKPLDGARTYMLRILPTLLDNTGIGSTTTIEYGFNGNGSSSAKPEISDAVIISSDSIKITFNKEVALDSPNILNTNYTLKYSDSGTTVQRIATSLIPYDATTFILRFDGLDFSTKYTLTFDILKDYSGVNTRKASDGSNSFEVRVGK